MGGRNLVFSALVFFFLVIGSLSFVNATPSISLNWERNDGTNYAYRVVMNSDSPPITSIYIKVMKDGRAIDTPIVNGRHDDTLFANYYVFAVSGDGRYSVVVSACDSGGCETESLDLTIDTTPPEPPTPPVDTTDPVVTITSPANGGTYGSHVTQLRYTASDDVGLSSCYYSADGGVTTSARTNCDGSFSVTSVEGVNNWVVYAVDDAGNTGSASVRFSVDTTPTPPVDTTDPVVTITSPANGGTYGSHVTQLRYTASDDVGLSSCYYSADGGVTTSARTNCDGSFSVTSVEGVNNWVVYAVDDAGNTGSASVRFSVDTTPTPPVDTTDPVVTITSPANGGTYGSHVTQLRYTASDDVGLSSCYYSADGGVTTSARTNCDGSFSVTSVEGVNNWVVYAVDDAGNTGSASVRFSVDIPTDSYLSVAGYWVDGGNHITINEGETTSFKVRYESDSPPITDINVVLYKSVFRNGVYSYDELVHTFVEDKDVNSGVWNKKFNVGPNVYDGSGHYLVYFYGYDGFTYSLSSLSLTVKDVFDPSVTITSPMNGRTYDSHVTELRYTASDDDGSLISCWYSTDGGVTTSARTNCDGSFSVTSVEGVNNWVVYALDDDSNVGRAFVEFEVDLAGTSDDDGGSSWQPSSYNVNNGLSDAEYYAQYLSGNSVAIQTDEDEAPVVKKQSFWDALVSFIAWLFGL